MTVLRTRSSERVTIVLTPTLPPPLPRLVPCPPISLAPHLLPSLLPHPLALLWVTPPLRSLPWVTPLLRSLNLLPRHLPHPRCTTAAAILPPHPPHLRRTAMVTTTAITTLVTMVATTRVTTAVTTLDLPPHPQRTTIPTRSTILLRESPTYHRKWRAGKSFLVNLSMSLTQVLACIKAV